MIFVDMDLIRHMVIQTNLYVEQYLRINESKLKRWSRARSWKNTTEDESHGGHLYENVVAKVGEASKKLGRSARSWTAPPTVVARLR